MMARRNIHGDTSIHRGEAAHAEAQFITRSSREVTTPTRSSVDLDDLVQRLDVPARPLLCTRVSRSPRFDKNRWSDF